MEGHRLSPENRLKKRVAILISGRGSNMAALIEAAKDNSYPAQIVLVLSNRPDAAGLLTARTAGISTELLDHTTFAQHRESQDRKSQDRKSQDRENQDRENQDREAFERALQAKLEAHRIDIVCLAGFMRLLTPWFVKRWKGRLINIHPALLPAFKGLHTHERALAAGAKTHGATVHFVAPEMDSGPTIIQAEVPVLAGDKPETLAARVLEVEHKIYPRALQLVAEGLAEAD